MKYDIPAESINLIYLDPPFFGTGVQKGEVDWSPGKMQISYDDSKKFWSRQEIRDNAPLWLKGIAMKKPDSHWKPLAKYLYYMMERLEACKRVLKPTGSIYLHCDWRASHYLKMVMDEVFGYENFKSDIVWYRTNKIPDTTKRLFYKTHDNILFYTKSNNYIFNPLKLPTGIIIRRRKMKKNKGQITNTNEFIEYEKQLPLTKSVITDIPDISISKVTEKSERIGYPTQKPEALLERIIKASSNEGDLVLDPFCGCGTTIIVAHKLNRRWIGIDIKKASIEVIKLRMDKMGLTQGKLDFKVEKPAFLISHKELMKMTGKQFERWVNKICNAKEPSYDRGVDGIMEDGAPIQTKTYKVKYDVISQFLTDAESHSEVPKPVKKIRIVSREGFDESAWEKKSWIELNKGVKVELLTPGDILAGKRKARNTNNK